ncbi:MAG: hypothetical protein OQK76_00265 [Gammaproteobacteria bacterium]|nr:hypothetical protein [Gammaproteobacteria bacterium]
MKLNYVASALLGLSVITTGCGGGGGGTPAAPTTLSGTAAAGAPLIGTVTVKGALGVTKSALIEADGSYDVDVTGLTAPYRLRAQGTVGGRTYKLHSYAVESDVGNTVNITPFTDLIVANAAQQIAESFFDSSTTTELDPAEVDAQETALQAKLQEVFDAVGVSSAIDLLNSTFSADHSQLDAALDLVRVEVDSTTNVATITNLIENTTITDSVLDTTDNTETLTVTDATALTATVTDTQAIATIFNNFQAAFATGLPTSNDQTIISSYFADDFYNDDYNKSLFLTDIFTDPGVIGITFSGVTVTNLDATAGTAEVIFSFGTNGMLEYEPETWYVAKNSTTGLWQLRGDQRIVDVSFSYHCNDGDGAQNFDGTSTWAGACGINTQYWDEDFTNNGTVGNAPIASGTVKIIDGTTSAVKATVYLGTPAGGTAGDVQVYNEQYGNFQGDWREFGTGAGQIDPSVFSEGDTIEYTLYTGDLDIITDSANPAVDPATLVTTYTDTVLFVPEITTSKIPTATTATLTAMSNFTLGNDLTVAWTLADGTRNEEVLVEISDSAGNRVEIWDWNFGTTATTKTYASSQLDTTTAGLLTTDATYNLKVRIYAEDSQTGQSHSRDYDVSIPGPAASGGTGGACDVTGVTTLTEFETIMDACGTVVPMVASDLIGNSFTFVNATNEVTTYIDASSGTFTNDGGTTVIPLTWSIDGRGYLTVNYTVSGVTFYDVYVAYGVDSTTGGLMVKAFTNEDNSVFEEIIIPVGGGTTSLTCGFETAWDDLNDQPSVFNSYDDFETVVADCGTPLSGLVEADITGTYEETWTDSLGQVEVSTIVMTAGGTGTYTSTLDGVIVDDNIPFNWTISGGDRVQIWVTGEFFEVWAMFADGSMKAYSEDVNWSPASDLSITDTTTLDGEIWTPNFSKL